MWAGLPDERDDSERERQEGPALSGGGPPGWGVVDGGWGGHSEQPHAAYEDG